MGITRETMGCHCTKDDRIPAREAADSASAPPPQPSTTPLQQVLQEAQRNSAQANATIAESYAECPICFDPLHEDQCVSLHRGQHRSCHHIVHERCANAIPPKESPSFEWTGRDSRHGFGQWMWIMTGGSAGGRCCWRSKRSADLTGTRSNSTLPRCGCDGTLTVQASSNSTSSVTQTASWLTSRLTPWPTSTIT